jgi:KDO2-lipid IV(A) lauroyltransferase
MFFFILLSKIPLRLFHVCADVLFFIMYYFPSYRKKIVLENLRNSFPRKSENEITAIAKGFYKNLADLTIETLKIPSINKEEIKKRVTIKNIEAVHDELKKGNSVIVLTGHQCNWEWLLIASSIHCEFPIDAVYKPMQIQLLDTLFYNMRSRFGARPLPMKDVYRSIIKHKNEARVLAMVADQTPAHSEIQYLTTFLNQQTGFFVGADKIAKSTGYPVFFLEMTRPKRGFYSAEFQKIIPKENSSFGIIESYSTLLEISIHKNPSDWLWTHKRWKYKDMKITRNPNK